MTNRKEKLTPEEILKYHGTGWSSSRKKWFARLSTKDGPLYIGQFSNRYAAAEACRKKEIELYGYNPRPLGAPNRVKVFGNRAMIYLDGKHADNHIALVSKEDVQKIKKMVWTLNIHSGLAYYHNGGKSHPLHKEILGPTPKNHVVVFKNKNQLDNRRANISFVPKGDVRPYNEIKILENHAEVSLFGRRGGVCLVSIQDVELIRKTKWIHGKAGYVVGRCNGKNLETMHRFLLNPEKGLVIDHINHNPLDNRRENLRAVSQSTNVFHSKRSEMVGVSKTTSGKKWRAYIEKNGRQYRLGTFDTFSEAMKARLDAEIKYYGEFAPRKGGRR